MTADEIRANDWLNGDHVDNSYGRITIDLLIEIAAQLAEANELKRQERRVGYANVHMKTTDIAHGVIGPNLTDSEIRQQDLADWRERNEPSVATIQTISGDSKTVSFVPHLTRNEKGEIVILDSLRAALEESEKNAKAAASKPTPKDVTIESIARCRPQDRTSDMYLEWLEEDNSRVLDVYHRVEYEGCTIEEAMDWFIDQQYKPTPPSTDNNPA